MPLALPDPTPTTQPGAAQRAYQHWRHGQADARRDRWREAARAFEQAADLDARSASPDAGLPAAAVRVDVGGSPPADGAAYALHAAHALIKSGRPVDALRRTRALRTASPRVGLAYTLESHALLALGRPEQAVECLRALPADVGRDYEHRVSLAVALQRARRHDEAIRAFFDALALRMDDALTHFRLGMSFKDLGLKAEAAECVRTAVTLGLQDSQPTALAQLAFLEREACRWPNADAALADLRAALARLPDHLPVETGAFTHAVLVDDPAEQLKVARHYARHVARLYPALPKKAARRHDGRLRIGYLSADFHEHATSQLLVQVLEKHDRARVDVTLLSTGPDDGSALRKRVVAASERFEELRGKSYQDIAERVRALGIDVLVDLKGATHDTLLPVLAQRPAPLQVGWLGFPGTSGAAYLDYIVGDEIVAPIADAADFAEKIAQLPSCYQPNDGERALPEPSSRADWGVADDGAPLLCAFHQSFKISAPVFDAWCELLRRLPTARLWLLRWNANVETALVAAARERGIAPERLVFAPLVPLADHLSRLACADVFLDAWPCNAHTTAGEALWCAVPVVTVKGRTFAQRVAASLLHAVALDELVADDVGGYLDRVERLVADGSRRVELREHLRRQRRESALFDAGRFARDLEALYERMWARAVAGKPPAALPAGNGQAVGGRADPGAREPTASRPIELPTNAGPDLGFNEGPGP